MATKQLRARPTGARFEYRVWGKHRRARRLLEEFADDQTSEHTEDCYLLVDDVMWNAKIRDNTLKIKRLVGERKGFEQWASSRHHCADTVPSALDRFFGPLEFLRSQRCGTYDLLAAITAVGPSTEVRPVVVTKHRRRHRVGDLRAEATVIRVHETSEVLHTLSIDGDDLVRLRALRNRLGLQGEDNVAVHNVLRSWSTRRRRPPPTP